MAIGAFAHLLRSSPRANTYAVLISALFWTIPHVFAHNIFWVFITGLILGALYLKSRSRLLPMWGHSLANTSWLGGLLVVIVYLLLP